MRLDNSKVGRVVFAGVLSVLLGAAPAIALAGVAISPTSADLKTSGAVGEETTGSFETAQTIQLNDMVDGSKNADGSATFYRVSVDKEGPLCLYLTNEAPFDSDDLKIACVVYDGSHNALVVGDVSVQYAGETFAGDFDAKVGEYVIEVSFDEEVPAGHPYDIEVRSSSDEAKETDAPVPAPVVSSAPATVALPKPATVYTTAAREPMYRLYNPYTGEHFYTSSVGECCTLSAAGWSYEGVGWTAPKKSDVPVYRLYNPFAGDHHYTTSAEELDSLVAGGWSDEGVGWYSADEDGVPIYRQYNPFATVGTHNYTTSYVEKDALVSAGWQAEGIGWYGIKS